MTDKEFAERLRDMVHRTDMIVAETREEHPPMLSVNPREVLALADELDPPRPEPGTVVWWRDCDMPWQMGTASVTGVIRFTRAGELRWEDWDRIEYKPAHILAPGQVAVTRDDIKTAIDALNAALMEANQ